MGGKWGNMIRARINGRITEYLFMEKNRIYGGKKRGKS
jgi:hypothetical protein